MCHEDQRVAVWAEVPAIGLPQHATARIRAGSNEERPARCRQTGTHRFKDFIVGVRAELVRVPECRFVGDHGNICRAAQPAEAGGTDFNADAVGQFKCISGAVGYQLEKDRRGRKGGSTIVESDGCLPLVGRDAQQHAALARGEGVLTQTSYVSCQRRQGTRLPAATADDERGFLNPFQRLALAAASETIEQYALVVARRLAHRCDHEDAPRGPAVAVQDVAE